MSYFVSFKLNYIDKRGYARLENRNIFLLYNQLL